MNAGKWATLLVLVLVSVPLLAAEPEAKPAPAKPAASGKSAAASNAQLGMSVTGSQEAPKVLYIVPWKTLDAVPAEPYVSGLLDEVFAPVDPVVFARSVRQHEQIQAGPPPAAESN